jgi:hypothetical protein
MGSEWLTSKGLLFDIRLCREDLFLSFTHLWFVNGIGLVSMGGRETEVRQQGQWNSHSQVTPWGRRTLGLERMLLRFFHMDVKRKTQLLLA